MEWHIILNKECRLPKKDEIVVGYWASGPEAFSGLCYYEPDDDNWVFVENGELISAPDYWIERP